MSVVRFALLCKLSEFVKLKPFVTVYYCVVSAGSEVSVVRSIQRAKMYNILCVICTENIDKDSVTVVTRCGHLFHRECIQRWVDK